MKDAKKIITKLFDRIRKLEAGNKNLLRENEHWCKRYRIDIAKEKWDAYWDKTSNWKTHSIAISKKGGNVLTLDQRNSLDRKMIELLTIKSKDKTSLSTYTMPFEQINIVS